MVGPIPPKNNNHELLTIWQRPPGTLVLGCIPQINQTDLALSLPNNFIGFVPLTSISQSLNKKVKALVGDSGGGDED